MKLSIWLLLPSVHCCGVLAVHGAEPASIELTAAQRALACAQLAPIPERFILTSDSLPAFEFAQPAEGRRLFGEYQLKTTIYDPEYQPVTKASKPGRHGAVVEIIPGKETKLPTTRRFINLYRLPDRTNFEQQSPALIARLKTRRWNFTDVPGANTAESARELAAMHEVPRDANPDSFYEQPIEKERQWWIGLKRRLYGYDKDKRFAAPFQSPTPIEGKPAPIIRKGTLAQAGMKPDAASRIDAVLKQWAEDSPEGFDVCIVRHGVVVLEKSYGMVRGKPVTDSTMFPLTSTSKMVTGIMLMQVVEQGRLTLDTPITELPGPLHGIKTAKPITLRALYSHTAFSVDIAPSPDMEERLAMVLPHLAIGQGYQYTGTSLELAWALASLTTGKSISTFARDHLAEPLGCKHTEVFNTGGSTQSTAHDLACIWQMMLNRGAYGDKRFLSQENFEEMLPRRLTKTLGPFTNDRVWGIGTMFWKVDGLSPFTFGHKGYFRSTAFVDPIHDLVVIMVRVDPPSGKKYDVYHPRFLKAIVDGLVDPVPAFPSALTLANLDLPPGKDRFVIETVVANPGPTDAMLEYRYETEGTHWKFEPASAIIKVPAKGTVPIRIEARFDPDRVSPLPMLRGAVYSAAGPKPPLPHVEYWLRPILRRSVTAQRVGKAPTLDGIIGAEEYGKQPDEPQLLETHGRKEPQNPARFRVAYDDKALYVAVTAAEKAPGKLSVAAKQRDDAAMMKEDHVEVVIDPTGDGKTRRQFAVNLAGIQWDARAGDVKWDARWSATVRASDDIFVVEFAIPFESFGVPGPKSGDNWALNVLRGRGLRDPKWELFSQWVMNYADFSNEKHFGVLQFK